MSTYSEDSTIKPPRHEEIPPDALNKLKVSGWKEDLRKQGQSTLGIKKVLLEVLKPAFKNKVSLDATTSN